MICPAPAHLEAHAHVNSALGPAGDHCFENIPLWGVCSQATPLTRIRLDFAHSGPPQSTPARLSRLSPPALTWSTLQRWPHSCRPVENAALYTSQCSGRRPEVAAAPSVSTLARSAGAATASPSCAPPPPPVLVCRPLKDRAGNCRARRGHCALGSAWSCAEPVQDMRPGSWGVNTQSTPAVGAPEPGHPYPHPTSHVCRCLLVITSDPRFECLATVRWHRRRL